MSSRILHGALHVALHPPEWQAVDAFGADTDTPEPEPELDHHEQSPAEEASRAAEALAQATLVEQQSQRIAQLESQLAELRAAVPGRIEQSRQAGFKEGEAAGGARAQAAVAAVIDRLARSVAEVAGFRAHYRRESEQELLKLSLGVARKVLHREITMDPRALLGLIRAALETLNAAELYRIRLAPAEAALLAPRIAEMGLPEKVEVIPDSTLERGAVVFDTVRGTVDASIPTQLSEIERGFADLLDSH